PGAVRQPRPAAHRLRGPNARGPPRLTPAGHRPRRACQDGPRPRGVTLLLLRRPGGAPDRGLLAHGSRLPPAPRGAHRPDAVGDGLAGRFLVCCHARVAVNVTIEEASLSRDTGWAGYRRRS